jgi:hypothetical protein
MAMVVRVALRVPQPRVAAASDLALLDLVEEAHLVHIPAAAATAVAVVVSRDAHPLSLSAQAVLSYSLFSRV